MTLLTLSVVAPEPKPLLIELLAARLEHLSCLNAQRQYAERLAQFVSVGQIDAVLALCGEMQREAVEGIEKLGRRK